jgi:hypothetical protein
MDLLFRANTITTVRLITDLWQYLSVINPMHKDAIRSLEVNFTLYRNHARLKPDVALKMISSIKGLQALRVNLLISGDLCVFNGAVGSQLVYWQVQERVLKDIEECPGWNKIKGLRHFSLVILALKLNLAFMNNFELHRMPGEKEKWEAMEKNVTRIVTEAKPAAKPDASNSLNENVQKIP